MRKLRLHWGKSENSTCLKEKQNNLKVTDLINFFFLLVSDDILLLGTTKKSAFSSKQSI